MNGIYILRRWLIRRLARKARPYLKSYSLLKTVKYKTSLVWEPEGERVLVLAPHMDDEVIGCGGTLYKHISKGAKVTVAYLTDGRAGSNALLHLAGKERKRRELELVETRKREARLAMQTLGVEEGIFLDVEETQLAPSPEIRSKLRRILDAVQPDFVYLPFFLEEHPDHRAVSRILLEATEDASPSFDCLGYEVWTPLFPNCLVEIDDAVEIKKQALQHYQSQLADKDYIHTTLGLNAYRSSNLLGNDCGFVEAFFVASLQDYRELFYLFVDAVS